MTTVKVEVTGAVVDGNASGSTIVIDKRSAERLVALGYVKYVEQKATQSPVKKESAPKKPEAKAKPKKKKDE